MSLPLFGPEAFGSLLVKVSKVDKKPQKHEDQIDAQDVREAEGSANGFRQRNAEDFGLVKYGNGLHHSNSFS